VINRIPPHLTAISGDAGGRSAGRLRLRLALGVALAIALGAALAIAIVSVLARIDDRFVPAKALAATIRYLQPAEQRFGRADLAVVSYHMGIGNLQRVLHPPDAGGSFATPGALYAGYAHRRLLPLPSNPRQLGLAYNPSIGWLAKRVGATPVLYRGLAPAALDLLVELAARVRALSGGAAPLTVQSAVLDRRYEGLVDVSYPAATTGYAFQIARRYVSRAQAAAFQAMLDRLRALSVIDWTRTPDTIDVTVASDASRVIVNGP
jgi:hypothetical protein